MEKRDTTAELTQFLSAHQRRLSRLAYVLTEDLADAEDLEEPLRSGQMIARLRG